MYQILLEGKQIKRNQVTGMHLMAGFLLLMMGFITWLVPNTIKQEKLNLLNWAGLAYSFSGLLLIILCIFFNKKIIQTKANFILRIIEIILLLPILFYSILQKWYLPAAYSGAALLGIILAYYWEKTGRKNKLATFDDQGVHIPGLGLKSNMPWQDVKKVLLRHNILTIDRKDNKLYQLTISPSDLKKEKEDFEAYCKIQIEAKKHLHKADW